MKNSHLKIIIVFILIVFGLFTALFVRSYKSYQFDNKCEIKCSGLELKEFCYQGDNVKDTCVNICIGVVENPCE